jgi:hypothetical protein
MLRYPELMFSVFPRMIFIIVPVREFFLKSYHSGTKKQFVDDDFDETEKSDNYLMEKEKT